jgi:hypothetical protein
MFARFWPAPVWLPFGGSVWRFHEYRLTDLARLEAWARRAVGDPYAAVTDAAALEDRAERRKALRNAYDLAERHGGGLADPALMAALSSRYGLVEQLAAAVRVEDGEPLSRAMEHATVGELDHALAIAWAIPPLDFAQQAVDREAGVILPHERRRFDEREWRASLWSLIEATHWTPAQIGRLALSQWDVIRSGGQWDGSPVVNPDKPRDWTWDEFRERVMGRRREVFEGPDEG